MIIGIFCVFQGELFDKLFNSISLYIFGHQTFSSCLRRSWNERVRSVFFLVEKGGRVFQNTRQYQYSHLGCSHRRRMYHSNKLRFSRLFSSPGTNARVVCPSTYARIHGFFLFVLARAVLHSRGGLLFYHTSDHRANIHFV